MSIEIIKQYDNLHTFLNKFNIVKFMNHGFFPHSKILKEEDLLFKYEATLYLELLKNIKTKNLTLLDIGCGRGGGLNILKKYLKLKKAYGCDINDMAIEYCKKSYKDFEIRAEFWAASDTNSGIFIRATNPQKIGADTSYEVNIWDIRPDPKYGSGAIVDFAAVTTPLQNTVGGKWNVLEIRAVGNEITVILNGIQTVKLNNSKFAAGPFALQYGAGVKGALGGPIKWRKVQVREAS